MRQFLHDLCASAGRSPYRGAGRSLAYLAPIAAIALLLYPELYSGTLPPTRTAHPIQSVNVALDQRFCGKEGYISETYSPYNYLAFRRELWSRPFPEAIRAEAGSLAAYCRTVTLKVVVSENSLMWLTRLALRVDPTLTPEELGQALGALRVLLLFVFGFALLRTGASVLLTAASVLVACAILRQTGVRDSIYPFVLVLPLLHASIYALTQGGFARWVREPRTSTHVLGLGGFAFGMGVLTGFSASMRTILLLICSAMFAVFLLVLFYRCGNRRVTAGTLTALGAGAAAFWLGYAAYNRVLVAPLRFSADPSVSNYAYHTFAHPLVMGLAVPANDFSRREGIKWDDMVAYGLAQRVMPGVIYLGPDYESALFRYYRLLWRKHPRQMAAVYVRKLWSTGDGLFCDLADVAQQFDLPRGPAEWMDRVANGPALFALGLTVFLVALVRHLGSEDNRLLIVAFMGLAALPSLVEAFLMHSIFIVNYYSDVLFLVCFVFLVSVQTGVDALAKMAPRARTQAVPGAACSGG